MADVKPFSFSGPMTAQGGFASDEWYRSFTSFQKNLTDGVTVIASGSGLTVIGSPVRLGGTLTLSNTGVTSLALTQPAAGFTVTNSGTAETLNVVATFALSDDLAALEGLGTNGLAARIAGSSWATRALAGTTGRLTVTNGDGVVGNPTLDIDGGYTGQTSIVTLGTVSTGAWNATAIGVGYGGTGLTSTPTNGQLPIGNGAGYALSTITAGSGVSVTNGAGTITIGATGSGGTVTSTSVVTANGVSGSVATATTTPAITLSLGAITPSSVAATGTVSGSNLSGTNTGDQTSVSGNAGTATKLATGRTLAVTGDLAWISPSFDGSANVTAAGTLATVNSNTGALGSSTAIPTITTNGKGLVTAVSTNAVIAPAGTLTGATLASGVTGSSLTSLGTLGALAITSSGSSSTVTITDTGGNGANIKFIGSGGTTPNKYIRAIAGKLSIVNSVYSAEIASVDDSGNLVVGGGMTAQAGNCIANAFVPASSTVPSNGLYLAATNTPSVSANTAEVARFTSFGIGLRASPPATWNSNYVGAVMGNGAAYNIVYGSSNGTGYGTGYGQAGVAQNTFWTGSANVTVGTGAGSQYIQGGGWHLWYSAASVSAGSTQTMNLTLLLDVNGQLALQAAGRGFSVKEGSNCKQGKSTLVAGAVTVSTTAVTSSSRIFVSINDAGSGALTNIGSIYVNNIVAGTSFDIRSTNVLDVSSVVWLVNEPS